MKKLFVIIILIILLIPLQSIALDSSIWYKFPIPEYSYSQAYITMPDFLNWEIHGDDNEIYLKGGMVHDYFLQRADIKMSNNGEVNVQWQKYEYHKSDSVYKKEDYLTSYYNELTVVKYFDLFNIWSDADLQVYSRKGFECQTDLDIEVGGGIGRIVSCTPVLRSIRLMEEMDIVVDENLVFQVADFYAKKSTFSKEYPDTWEEEFYQEIAEMIGHPDQVMKVRRILTSSIYETVSRSRGWEVKLGYGNNFFTGVDPHPKGHGILKAEYRLPWGLTKQLALQAQYDRNLDDDSSELGVSASFEIEHSYTWMSYIEVTADKIFNSSEDDEDMNYYFVIGTEKNIFNRLVSDLSLEYRKISDSEDPYFNLRLDLRYYIW
jgi:hypothetical protein